MESSLAIVVSWGAKVSERLESDVGIEPVAHWEAQPQASSKKEMSVAMRTKQKEKTDREDRHPQSDGGDI